MQILSSYIGTIAIYLPIIMFLYFLQKIFANHNRKQNLTFKTQKILEKCHHQSCCIHCTKSETRVHVF